MIDQPPVALDVVDQRAVPLRPPLFLARASVHQRVMGRVLPRAQRRARPRHHRHVAGGRPPGAPLCRHQIEPVAPPYELGALEAETLGHPLVGIGPALIHAFHLARHLEPVWRQGRRHACADVQIALSVAPGHVPRVDVAIDTQIHRLAPGACRVAGGADKVGKPRPLPCAHRLHHRQVEIVATVMVHQVGRPHIAQVHGHRVAQRPPVDQVA